MIVPRIFITLSVVFAVFAANEELPSSSWSGALVHKNGTKYNHISAEMVIPNVTFPNGYNQSHHYQTTVWVGFGGYPFKIGKDSGTGDKYPGIFQTGFMWLYDNAGDHGVSAWWEWYPEPYGFWEDEGLLKTVTPGDRIRMSITMKSDTVGTALFENLSRNTNGSKEVTMKEGDVVDFSRAEWIIEDGLLPLDTDTNLMDYGTMKWENMVASSTDGTKADLGDAYSIRQGGTTQGCDYHKYASECFLQPPSSMFCKYEGFRYEVDGSTLPCNSTG